ncbi:MAG: acyl carrier protein [Erysipelotrichaceae bacterium]
MFEEIKEVLIDAVNCDEAQITPESTLKDDLAIDSLASVELVLELETKFDISITDDELLTLVTVQDVINIVESKKA